MCVVSYREETGMKSASSARCGAALRRRRRRTKRHSLRAAGAVDDRQYVPVGWDAPHTAWLVPVLLGGNEDEKSAALIPLHVHLV